MIIHAGTTRHRTVRYSTLNFSIFLHDFRNCVGLQFYSFFCCCFHFSFMEFRNMYSNMLKTNFHSCLARVKRYDRHECIFISFYHPFNSDVCQSLQTLFFNFNKQTDSYGLVWTKSSMKRVTATVQRGFYVNISI